MKLSYLATIINGQLMGQDAEFHTVSTDTRTIKPGDLFIALIGPNFNANHFIEEAANKGAAAAVVCENMNSTIPVVVVKDTLAGLGKLGAYWRDQFKIPVVAVTGSCGKTTSKAMMAAIFAQQGNVLATVGTLNNDIGVPLTLLNINASHKFAVIECGANHLGEIDYITKLTKPDVAVITNAGPVHLEGFGDMAGVAKGKGEIFHGLNKDGIVVINADDSFCDYWQKNNGGHKVLTFGEKNNSDVRADSIVVNGTDQASFQLNIAGETCDIQLPLLGKHNIYNALAAATTATALNVPMQKIKKGLETMQPESKRLIEKIGINGVHIIDDTYNANPLSVKAALEILASRKGNKIFVFGQMMELGENAKQFHVEVGEQAKKLGIDALYAYGGLAKTTVQAFGDHAHYFQDPQILTQSLQPELKQGTTILVKGSRAMQMENIVTAIS